MGNSFHQKAQRGFSLVELMVALAISAMVLTTSLRIVLAATGGFRAQQAMGQLLGDARFALQLVEAEIRSAGFHPQPWTSANRPVALTASSADAYTPNGDRLVLRRHSTRNCYGNPNPVQDVSGLPRSYLLENDFHVTANGDLVQVCRYGPDAAGFVTQINGLGLLQGVEAFELLFAEDLDEDGQADRWVSAGNWQDEQQLRAVKMGLLIASHQKVGDAGTSSLRVLDRTISDPADGRLRQAWESTVSIRGREQ